MDKSLLSYGLSDLSVAWVLKDLRSAFKPDGLEKWFSEKGRSKGRRLWISPKCLHGMVSEK